MNFENVTIAHIIYKTIIENNIIGKKYFTLQMLQDTYCKVKKEVEKANKYFSYTKTIYKMKDDILDNFDRFENRIMWISYKNNKFYIKYDYENEDNKFPNIPPKSSTEILNYFKKANNKIYALLFAKTHNMNNEY